MRHFASRQRGFTLVELMIVVVILGILAAIAAAGLTRYRKKARLTGATAMLAELASREELYRLEFAGYLPARNETTPAATNATPTEASDLFYPSDPNVAFDVDDPVSIELPPGGTAVWPTAWRQLGVRPRDTVVYCTFLVNAGNGGVAPPAKPSKPSYGERLVKSSAAPWYYALAACNMKHDSDTDRLGNGFVTVLGLSNSMGRLNTFNENE